MSLASIKDCGQGINADLTPEELGTGFWSASQNMRFADGYATRFRGTKQVFATPTVTPYYLMPYAVTSSRYWVHAGLTSVFADDGTTRTNITGTALTGAIDDRFTGGTLNGVMVLNNGVDKPRFWGGTGLLADLTGWGATHKCAVLRPFKNFLIALDIIKGAIRYPHMVKWSDIAVPGAIPTSWDETNPALDAGENDLAETPDLLVDCLPLGDVNIVYKERSMYAMTYIGAPYIFRFQRLPGDVGMLARGCAVATPVGHVVLTAGDVIVHAGQGSASIANAVMRDYIFKNINATYYKRAFVTSNPQKNEVWVCFPFGDSAACNMAAVWNWVSKVWSVRTLVNVTYGASGQISIASTSTTWSDADSWQSDATSWNENEYSPAEARLMLCHSTPLISLSDTGTSDFGAPINASMERIGIHLDTPQIVKTVRAIYPRIDGPTGSVVNIQVGSSMTADAAAVWQTPVPFTVGVDQKIDSFASGRYLAVCFGAGDYPGWRMRSFDIEYTNAGLY
jgi:hypothetical protein